MKKHASVGNGVGSNGKMKNTVKYYHKDTLEQKFFSESNAISDEWIKGVTKSKTNGSGETWYTNLSTGENKRLDYDPGEGWKAGRSNVTTTLKKIKYSIWGIFKCV